MMRYLTIFLVLVVCFTSCKPYQNTKVRKNQISYESFKADQKFYRSTDGVLKYIDKGEGPAIVLLHGVPTSGWVYRKMMYPLLAGKYRIIIPDMLGFGASDSPEGYEIYNAENHAKRLLALMEHLQINEWSQVVHDAGGLWTWELIRQDSTKIKNLIMLNAIVYEEGFYPPVRFKEGVIAKIAMSGYSNGLTNNILLGNLFKTGLQKNTLNKMDVEGYKTPLTDGKTDALYYFFTQTCNELPDYSDVFNNIDLPVAVIWGIHDTMLQWTPQQKKIRNAFDVADEDLHLIDEKHFIQETEARNVSYKILNFLEKNQK